MTQAIPRVAPVISDGALDADIHCASCGYNLRGLRPSGRCPECGTPIARSLRGDLLAVSDPNWVARIARGATYAYRGFIALVLLIIAAVIGVGAGLALFGPIGPGDTAVVVLLGGVVAWSLAGFAAMIIGIWWLTTPGPREVVQPEVRRTRTGCRIALLALLGAWLATKLPINHPVYAAVASLSQSVAFAVWAWLFFKMIEHMGSRVPSEEIIKTAKRGRRRLIAFVVLIVLVFSLMITAITVMAVRTAAPTPGAPPFGGGSMGLISAASCLGGLAGLAFLLVASAIEESLRRCRRVFREAAAEAERNWDRIDEMPAPSGSPGVSSEATPPADETA
ncbi:MAG: hypothetical protein JXQ73_05235 [Phycisphaerae bacterium]|nr:hypothetical protein [Phycisphaerae bacterium]